MRLWCSGWAMLAAQSHELAWLLVIRQRPFAMLRCRRKTVSTVSDLLPLLPSPRHYLLSTVPRCPAIRAGVMPINRNGAKAALIGYLSATGIYGDRDGDWVGCRTRSMSDRSRRRLAAELGWHRYTDPVCGDIFTSCHLWSGARDR